MVQAVLGFQVSTLQHERRSGSANPRSAGQADACLFRAGTGVDQLDDHFAGAVIQRSARVELTLTILRRPVYRYGEPSSTFVRAEHLLHVVVWRAVGAQVVEPDHVWRPLPRINVPEQRRIRRHPHDVRIALEARNESSLRERTLPVITIVRTGN